MVAVTSSAVALSSRYAPLALSVRELVPTVLAV